MTAIDTTSLGVPSINAAIDGQVASWRAPSLPGHAQLRLPLLAALLERGPMTPAAATAAVAKRLTLPAEVVAHRRPLPSWSAQGLPVLQHRMRSVFQGLLDNGFTRRPRFGQWAISRRGSQILNWDLRRDGHEGAPAALLPPVLDACCGGRMFWFDRADARAVFVDKRQLVCQVPDTSMASGLRTITIQPDICADFTALPFPDESFAIVVFDPPHLKRNGRRSWLGLKYGRKRPGSR